MQGKWSNKHFENMIFGIFLVLTDENGAPLSNRATYFWSLLPDFQWPDPESLLKVLMIAKCACRGVFPCIHSNKYF